MTQTRQVFKYTFFAFKPKWRSRPEAERRAGIAEFLDVVERHRRRIEIRTYNTTGLKLEDEFLLWAIGTDVEQLIDLGTDLANTEMYPSLKTTHSYLAIGKPSQYIPPHEHEQAPPEAGVSKYLFVYPFVKTKAWYQLPFDDRRAMMGGHTATGHKYPTIRINTGYSFGLDDQEFVVSFEGDRPEEFLDMVQEMRSSKATAYTERDTPMFTCLRQDLKVILERLSFKGAGVAAAR